MADVGKFRFEAVQMPGGPTASDRLRGFAMATKTDQAVSSRQEQGAASVPSPGRDMWVHVTGNKAKGGRRGSAHPMP